MPTKIEWTDETWNPITGCTPISEGCQNCYAKRMANRLKGRYGYDKDNPFKVTLHPDKLDEPLKWKKPRMIFVCSMGDLFHEDVPTTFIDQVLEIIAACPQHTFLALTKRPENLKHKIYGTTEENPYRQLGGGDYLSNLWLGVTAENQQRADERIPMLLQIPAVKRFVSIEPMLGPVRFKTEKEMYEEAAGMGLENMFFSFNNINPNGIGLDWTICGGETGPGARPMHPDWARSLRDQCHAAGVPFFFKQWGEWFPRDQWEHNPELVLPDDEFAYHDSPKTYVFKDLGDVYPVHRVGKKAAGRLLGGQEWNEYPGVAT